MDCIAPYTHTIVHGEVSNFKFEESDAFLEMGDEQGLAVDDIEELADERSLVGFGNIRDFGNEKNHAAEDTAELDGDKP